MVMVNQPTQPQQPAPAAPAGMRRLWKTPTSPAFRRWAIFIGVYCAAFYLLYLVLFHARPFTGPFEDPFRTGIMSFILILATTAYTLRRRFARNLPGKTEDWLWMHVTLGVGALALALLHENFRYVLHDSCFAFDCLSRQFWGTASIYALIFIVVSGMVGRLLDRWQTRIIAQDAASNRVGILQSVRERILELEYVVERLSAGKSDAFKAYCLAAFEGPSLPLAMPALARQEQADFMQAHEALVTRARLAESAQRQQQAITIFKVWRIIHVTLVPLAILIITYHGVLELLTNVLHIIKV